MAEPVPDPQDTEIPPEFSVSPLARDPRLAGFRCEDNDLTKFIASDEAFTFEREGLGRTYLVNRADDRLLGYYTISTYALRASKVKSGYSGPVPRGVSHIPSLLIGRLAIDQEFARKPPHYGRWVVKYIVGTAGQLSKLAGLRLIVLQANPRSIGFYQNCNFVPIGGEPSSTRKPTMFLDLLRL